MKGPYRVGQYAPDEHLQPYVRLWDGQGKVICDFPATSKGWTNARQIAAILNEKEGLLACAE